MVGASRGQPDKEQNLINKKCHQEKRQDPKDLAGEFFFMIRPQRFNAVVRFLPKLGPNSRLGLILFFLDGTI